MSKKEVIWRDILAQFRLKKRTIFTQKELAADFGFSLSTVFNAAKPLRESGIIDVHGRNFQLTSYKKLLLLLASHRSLTKDIVYRAHTDVAPKDLEAAMPPHVSFGLYSAFAFAYRDAPADYDHVYIYADTDQLKEIKERLSSLDSKNKNPNFFVLKQDQWLARYNTMPLEQIFVDIWNAPEWYAKDFLKRLEELLPFAYE
jgi:hypothetical protein